MTEFAEAGASLRSARLRLSAALWRRPWLKLGLLLAAPVLVFAVVYLGALVSLFVSAFWQIDSFTAAVIHKWTLDNFKTLWNDVRIYAWRTILAKNGALNWVLNGLGLPDAGLAYTNTAMWIVFSYVWLPFMVLPVYAALERIPDSYLEASQDLGAKGSRTLRSVILPLAIPGIVAGSIFTFSLTLGDFITPALVGGAGSSFIGNIVEDKVGQPDIPFAAAFATVPVVVMGIYLLIARRLGAFEAV